MPRAHGSEVSKGETSAAGRRVRFLLSQEIVVIVQSHWVESVGEINGSYPLKDRRELGRDDR